MALCLWALLPAGRAPGAPDVERQVAEWKALLLSADAQQRSAAATSLLLLKEDAGLDALRSVLSGTNNEEARVSILKAVALQHDTRCLEDAIKLLDDPAEEVRKAARKGVESMTDSASVNRLLKVLADGKASVRTRAMAAEALAAMRRVEAVPALIALLDADVPALRVVAEQCLVKITTLSLGPKTEPWSEWWEQHRTRSREEILEMVLQRQAVQIEELRRTAAALWIQTLSDRKNPQDPKPLVAALKSDLPDVRRWVAEEIVRAKVTTAYAALIDLLSDPSPIVRTAAAQGLGQAGDAQSVAPLIIALDDLVDSVRAAAARALGDQRSKLAVPRLAPLLRDAGVAQAAAEALGKIGDPVALADLADLLRNTHRALEARRAAATALGLLHDPRACDALIKALGDPDVRWFSVDALGELGSAQTTGPLQQAMGPLVRVLLTDPKADNREATAVALGRLGIDGAVDSLVQALSDDEPRVADKALAAFVRIAAGRIELYELHARQSVERRQYAVAGRLYLAAIDSFGKSAELADAVRNLRLGRARALALGRDFAGAKAEYDALLALGTATPSKDPALYEAQADVLRNVGDEPALLKLYVAARKNVPEKAEDWWSGTLASLDRLAEKKQYAQISLAINDLRQEDPNLGGEKIRARLLVLEALSQERLVPRKVPIKVSREIINQWLEKLAQNEEARNSAKEALGKLGFAVVPALVKYGLTHKDKAVQTATIDILESITGRSFGLKPDATDEERTEAVKKWVEVWEAEAKKAEANPEEPKAPRPEEPKPAP